MKTRVAIVLPYFGKGGAESMVSRLASHLDLSKIEIKVFCIYGTPQNNSFENAVICHGVDIVYIGKGLGFSLTAINKLWKQLSAYKPDIVHTHLSACVYCTPWIIFHNVKMLHTVHSMPIYELIKPKRYIMGFMYMIGKAIPVAISKEIMKLTSEMYLVKFGPELVYNPVDIKQYAIKKKEHEGFIIVTVGRLSREKNHMLLLEAFKKLNYIEKDMSMIIVGEGELRKNIEDYIKNESLENKVRLTGNVDNVQDYLAMADLFVMSSNYEGLPLSVLEAMSASLPVVSTDVGGVSDIVTDNGILIKKGNVEELVKAILKMKHNLFLREKMSKKSFINVQSFDADKIAMQYIELYTKYSKKELRGIH